MLNVIKTIKYRIKKMINFVISKVYYNLHKNQVKLHCSVCANDIIRFLPIPNEYKEQSKKYGYKYFGTGEMTPLYTYICPSCGATDRERLYMYWLENYYKKKNNISKKEKMIHFAPENILSKALKDEKKFEYYTADLFMKNVDFQVDLMKLPFKDEEYDFFICSHVLEHVENDRQVVSELYRILKKGGSGILMAPISLAIEETYEDSSIVLPEDRWKHFGQDDHVRLYSHNGFVDLLQSSGFKVNQLGIDNFGTDLFYSLGLKESSILYVVEK